MPEEGLGPSPEEMGIKPEDLSSTEEKAPPVEVQKPEKMERLFGHCFEIQRLENGDLIPVGGDLFSGEPTIEVVGDFGSFEGFFQEAHEKSERYNKQELPNWLRSQGVEIDEELFASLYAFTKVFEQRYLETPGRYRGSERKALYRAKGRETKLSDVFEQNSAECAEIAALAQYYLQREGVDSKYFSGDALWDRAQEFSEEHSFIVVAHKGEAYIYDPTNPTDTSQGKFPSIYKTEAKFDKEVRKGQKRFVTAKNILSGKELYLGVNDGTSVVPEKHIV